MTYEELSQLGSATFLTWSFHYGQLSAVSHEAIDEALEWLGEMEDEGSGSTYGIEVFADGRPLVMIQRSGPKGDPWRTPEWEAAVGPWERERSAIREAEYAKATVEARRTTWAVELERPDGKGASIMSVHQSEDQAVEAAKPYGDRATVKKRANR